MLTNIINEKITHSIIPGLPWGLMLKDSHHSYCRIFLPISDDLSYEISLLFLSKKGHLYFLNIALEKQVNNRWRDPKGGKLLIGTNFDPQESDILKTPILSEEYSFDENELFVVKSALHYLFENKLMKTVLEKLMTEEIS